jgi:myosin protein heavy chain
MVLNKRPFDDTNSLHTSFKKSKESSFPMKIMKTGMLRLVEESIRECERKRSAEEQKLHSIERDIEDFCKEILNKKKQASYVKRINQYYKKMQNKIEGVKDLAAKEARVCLIEDLIKKHMDELEKNKIELRKVMDSSNKDGGRKEEELKTLSRKIAECTKEIETKKEELDATKIFVSGKVEELYSERSKLQKVMSKRKTDQCAQMKDFESTKKQVEGRAKELESKQEDFEGQVRDFESKKKYFNREVKKLRSKEKLIEIRVNELESEKKHFENQVKEFESKEKLFERRVHDLKLFKYQFESQLMELKSKEKQFEGRMKELESKEKHFEVRVKEFELKERDFEGRMREFKSKEEDFESRVREFESKEREFKGRVWEFEVKRLELQLKELKSKGNKFEGQVRNLESMQNNFDGQPKELDLRDDQYETLIKPFEEEIESGKFNETISFQLDLLMILIFLITLTFYVSDDQLSPTIDGRSFHLFPFEEFDELESDGNDTLVNLLASSSDPSKDVLDIIQNPLIPRCNGDNVVIIDECHIDLLEKLMRISPHVKPHVREEAMKLALSLKAYIGENTENSVPVLGFLLLLSIYGLVSSFDEDEVLNLFGFVAQHKIAVELFGIMGLVHKISGMLV